MIATGCACQKRTSQAVVIQVVGERQKGVITEFVSTAVRVWWEVPQEESEVLDVRHVVVRDTGERVIMSSVRRRSGGCQG